MAVIRSPKAGWCKDEDKIIQKESENISKMHNKLNNCSKRSL
jgi:hypothetical protein